MILERQGAAINMIEIVKADGKHPDFVKLVVQLNAYLKIIDGDDHEFYNQFNGIEQLKHVILLHENTKPVACGALKEYSKDTVEIKRMFTVPESRGKGIASKILRELEKWSVELGFEKCILETGKKQKDAVALYQKNGYRVIQNYPPYIDIETSMCFEKVIH